MKSLLLGLNHVALQVKDLDTSINFYKNILGLQVIVRPELGFPGAWFDVGAGQELHLLPNLEHTIHSGSRTNHWAIQVSDIQKIASKLTLTNYPFRQPKQRADGAWQLFINDPDGHTLELMMK